MVDEKKVVLIDTDAGIDDALAIFMCLQAHKTPDRNFRVVGITCVNGNTNVDNVTRNVTRILIAAKCTEIPIFRGCEAPIVLPYLPGTPYHGSDGFGDAGFPHIEPKVEPIENGVSAIIRLAHEHKGKLTILALGPLTNLAMAVRLDPSIKNCIREIFSMGGNLHGVGNETVCGEFNFVVDPEAVYITLSTFLCPINVVPWEVCLNQGIRPHDWRKNILGKIQSPCMDLINAIDRKNMENPSIYPGWIPCDELASAILIDSDVVKKSVKHHCTVELNGTHTRGMMVIDFPPCVLNQRENVTIISEIKSEILEKVLIWGAGGNDYKNQPWTY